MNFTKILIILLAVLMVAGCRKDIDGDTEKVEIVPNVPFLYDSNISGLVINEEGAAIENAIVDYLDYTETTDENGYFLFEDVPVNEEGTLVTIKSEGFINGYKFAVPTRNHEVFLQISMIARNSIGSFSNSEGGTVGNDESMQITFPPNAIKTADGSNYEGIVSIEGHYYNPDDPNILRTMPGDLRGVDAEFNPVQLATFGMLSADILGEQGQKLVIGEGFTATIKMRTPEISNLPGTIPLWHFDEASGLWKEEGSATLQDGFYVGTVTHFSFWNCDAPFPVVLINGQLVDAAGNPIAHASIKITVLGSGICGYGWTDSDGYFSGKVPTNESLRMSIENDCWTVVQTMDIGPYTEEEDLGQITVDSTEDMVNISGRLLCEGTPVTNGYIKLNLSSQLPHFVEVDENGFFNQYILVCPPFTTNLSYTSYDRNNNAFSDKIEYGEITGTEVDLGDIESCTFEIEEWFSLGFFGNEPERVYEVNASITSSGLVTNAWGTDVGVGLTLIPPVEGLQPAFSFSITDLTTGQYGCFNGCDDLTVDITNLGKSVDDFVIGTYAGVIPDLAGEPLEVAGDFKIRLDNVTQTAYVRGRIWYDDNENGIQDPDETQAGETVLNAYDADGNLFTSIDVFEDGIYVIGIPAGEDSYLEVAEVPFGYSLTGANQGSDDTVDSDFMMDRRTAAINIPFCGVAENVDLGFRAAGTIACTIDTDNQSACWGEATFVTVVVDEGVAPFTFELFDGTVPQTVNENTYTFDVYEPGTYQILVTDANGDQCENQIEVVYDDPLFPIFTTTPAGCGNTNGSITVFPDGNGDGIIEVADVFWPDLGISGTLINGTYDLSNLAVGTYLMITTDLNGCQIETEFTIEGDASFIGNQVWVDAPGGSENIFDSGDLPLEGVQVRLYESDTPTIVDSIMTDQNGTYLFTGDYNGDYRVEFIIPEGYAFIVQGDEIEDQNNSDVDPITGFTGVFTVNCPEVILWVDCGVIEI